MLTWEENELVRRVGPGAPMGDDATIDGGWTMIILKRGRRA